MMTVDDTLALLKAGVSEKVILRQVAATGAHLALSVPQILKLKAAGASDALLAALMGPTTAPAAGGARPEGQSIRVYREKNEAAKRFSTSRTWMRRGEGSAESWTTGSIPGRRMPTPSHRTPLIATPVTRQSRGRLLSS